MNIDKLKNEILYKEIVRTLTFDKGLSETRVLIDEENRTMEVSVSSEIPVKNWFGYEVLDHKRTSIRLERFKDGAAVRDTHYGDQIGVILKTWIDFAEKKLRCLIKFSKNLRAQEIFQDIIDGIRRNVSIRYIVHEIQLDKVEEDVETYRVTDWEPIHLAFEPDPADPKVGVGRSKENELTVIPLNLADKPEDAIENFNRENKNNVQIKLITNQRSSKMANELTQEEKDRLLKDESDRITKAVNEAGEKEARRIANITACARDFKNQLPGVDLEAEATKYIQNRDKSYENFFDEVVRTNLHKPEALRTPETTVGLSNKETKDYSIRNIILYQLGKLNADKVKMELDASRALEDNGVVKNYREGILLPNEVLNRRREIRLNGLSSSERDLIIGTAGSGGYLKRDQYIPQSFIEILQNSMAFYNAGVDVITGLVGDIPMNRELDNYTYYHVGEGSGPTKSSITFSQEKMSPKKAGVLAKYSYEFLMQGQPGNFSVESYVEKRLAIACALGADYDIGYGSGSSYQPKGLKNWTGVGSVTGAGFTRSKALQMQGQLYTGNAQDLGTMRWLSTGATRGTLKDKKVDEGSGIFLCNDQNLMIGLDYSIVSNQLAAGDLMLGVWPQILVGFWNQFEIVANPYGDTEFAAGDVKVRALQALDVFVLNAAAFSVAEGVN